MFHVPRLRTMIPVAAAAFILTGCAATPHEFYAMTGGPPDAQERKEQLRWTDQKGRYRPELRAQGGAPLR